MHHFLPSIPHSHLEYSPETSLQSSDEVHRLGCIPTSNSRVGSRVGQVISSVVLGDGLGSSWIEWSIPTSMQSVASMAILYSARISDTEQYIFSGSDHSGKYMTPASYPQVEKCAHTLGGS